MKKSSAENKSRKNLNSALLLFLVVLVVAVSGCISNLGFGPKQQTIEAPNDVMVFQDNAVIPNPPVLTGDTFTTDFTIKNLDNFDDANNVNLELYDWGVCEPTTCKPGSGSFSYIKNYDSISPNDVQQVECQFKSPSSEKIGGLQASCPIRYKLTYDFSGITTTELNVISNQKFQELSRAGQTPTVTSVQSKSRGPIKVDFSFGVNQPVRASTIDATDSSKNNIVKIPMYIRVENKGSGKTTLGAAAADIKISGVSYSLGIGQTVSLTNNYKLKFKEVNAQDKFAIFVEILPVGVEGKEYDLKEGKVNTATLSEGSVLVLEKLDITYGGLFVKVPSELGYSGSGLSSQQKCSRIICDSFSSEPEVVDGKETRNCKLTLQFGERVEFVKDKSQVFKCELTSPDESTVPELKTYSIQSEVKYTYQIGNDFNVAIKPMTFG